VTSDDPAAIAATYRAFAQHQARGRSSVYESLAGAVAEDSAILNFLAALPPDKRQPQLLFAAARYLGVPPAPAELRDLAIRSPDALTQVIRTHRTQTNEPARCAVFLPALAQLPEPLALIEVGASAGLTLLFDRYSYDYAGHRLTGADPGAPTLRCRPSGPVPLPARIPAITWRAGLDLNPLDVTSEDDVRWLSCLVWPGESDRRQRLAQAVAAARRDPPPVYRGDLLTDLPALAAQAPPDSTLVVYDSSVLYQVDPALRDQFTAAVRALGATWLSSEEPGVLPGIDHHDPDELLSVLARDGQPIAFADSHGAWLRWLRTPRQAYGSCWVR
jgi:hypothetical protein